MKKGMKGGVGIGTDQEIKIYTYWGCLVGNFIYSSVALNGGPSGW